jgi:hypothetical protein
VTDKLDDEDDDVYPIITYTKSGHIGQRRGVTILDAPSTMLLTLADPAASDLLTGSFADECELVIVNRTTTPHVLYRPGRPITQIPGIVGAGLRLYAGPDGTWWSEPIEDYPIG